MAKNLNGVTLPKMLFPLSMERQAAFPLDKSSVYYSKSEAQNYASSDPYAYVGQFLTVVEDGMATAYVIQDEAGTLFQLGSASEVGDIEALLANKVDKEVGKGLSTEDFTTELKTKLEGIEDGADANQNAISKIKVGEFTVTSNAVEDTVEIAGENGISVSAADKKITIQNSGVRTITTGDTNGTIKVNTNGVEADVAVRGLGSAAYTETSAYAPSSHTEVNAAAEVLGHVKLSDATNGESLTVDSGFAATPSAVAKAMKLAQEAKDLGSSAYKYKGSVDSIGELPEDAQVGDVYNVGTTDGANYAWNGTAWDNIGGIVSVDAQATDGSLNPVSSDAAYDIKTTAEDAISTLALGEDNISLKWTKPNGGNGTIQFVIPEYDDVTGAKSGLMTPELFNKLNGIADGAEVNQNAYGKIKINAETLVADDKTATFEIAAGNNVSLATEGNKITISSEFTDTKYTAGQGLQLSGTEFRNTGVLSIVEGETNGKIKVNTNGSEAEVAVHGLGSAAYTESSAYAKATHNQSSDTITSLTGYAKAGETGSIIATDNLNTALGKLEKKVDDALPLAGGTVTGDLEVQGTLTADASSAKKLSVADTGSENAFVYIKDGVPVASPYTIQTSVPAGAKFTDTTYTTGTDATAGITKLFAAEGQATDGAMTQKAVTTALANKLAVDGTAAKATADASGNTITTTYATKAELSSFEGTLAEVATSGSYNDLTDKPESLKSPFSLKVKNSESSDLIIYDGSSEKTLTLTADAVGLGNVTNESKETLFTNSALTGTPTAPTASLETNTTQVATTAFVQNLVQSKIAAADAMIFKGTIGATGATVTELPAEHHIGWTYKVIDSTISVSGVPCEIGDMIICLTDGSTASDDDWTVVQANIDGAVTGPTSAVANHVAIFNGATGKNIKDSGFTIETSVPASAKFTDENVTVEENDNTKILLTGVVSAGNGKLKTDSNVFVSTNSGELHATTVVANNFTGLASKATADASGNTITATYATKAELISTTAKVIESSGASTTIESSSEGVTVITVDQAAYNLSFTPAANSVYAEKFIHLKAGVATTVTYSGATFALNSPNPTWGNVGKNLFLKATFVAGRVILNVLDNDQVTITPSSLSTMTLDNLVVGQK